MLDKSGITQVSWTSFRLEYARAVYGLTEYEGAAVRAIMKPHRDLQHLF